MQLPAPGIYSMSNDDYHQGPGRLALSKGGLVELSRSPAHYRAMLEKPHETTPAMTFGTQFHCAVLEPDVFAAHYVLEPKFDKRTKTGKEEYSSFQESLAENQQEPISQESLDLITAMQASLRSSDVVSVLLSNGVAEQSIFWQDDTWRFTCKCRPDFINIFDHIVIDLKTTTDASPEAFSRTIINFRYHWQAAHYLAGVNAVYDDCYTDFVLIAVEKAPPFAFQVYQIAYSDIYYAQQQIKPLMRTYAKCLETDTWPGPPDAIQLIELPTKRR